MASDKAANAAACKTAAAPSSMAPGSSSWLSTVTVVSTLRMLATMSLVPVNPRIIAGVTDDVAAHSASISFFGAVAQLLVLPSAPSPSPRPLRFIGAAPLLACQVLQQAAAIVAAATTQASIGDAVAPAGIAAATGRVAGASMGAGMLLGPAVGAALDATLGFPGVAAFAVGALLSAFLGYALLLPETLKVRKAAGPKFKNPAASLRVLASPGLASLAVVAFLSATTRGEQAVYHPFMMEQWGLGASGIAAAMFVVGVDVLLAQSLLVKPLVATLGAGAALKVGLFAAALQRASAAVVAERRAAGDADAPESGALAAALASLNTLAVICSSEAFAGLYRAGKAAGDPARPFALGGALAGLALLAALRLPTRAKAD
ncbi:hypothetical protein JL720_485 [Aureococcus anophagefferens]|nr:hypothetical protein JL720_485 [Aureococcus anophagefferens]